MSHTFSLSIEQPPGFQELIDTLALSDLRCHEPAPGEGDRLPEGERHFFRYGISSRLTRIALEQGRFEVCVFSLASSEDCDLALRLVEIVARLCGSPVVHSESAGPILLEDLRAAHDERWIDQLMESGTRALAHLIREGRGPMEIPGPVRSFFLGMRFLGELESEGPHDELRWRLLEAMRRVQWNDSDRYPPAGIFEATTDRQGSITYAAWRGERVLFPGVDFALVEGLSGDEEHDPFFVPADSVPRIAGSRWSWLDERQGLLEAFDSEWPEVVKRARRFEVTLMNR
jgi:hypothetical protein